MIPAALLPIIQPLLANGLGLVANAVLAKGKKVVEDKLGVELKPEMSSEDLARVLPRGAVVRVSGNHLSALTDPALARAIADFLDGDLPESRS